MIILFKMLTTMRKEDDSPDSEWL